MTIVKNRLAASLSGKYHLGKHHSTELEKLTRMTFNIFARKITKMVFGMGGSYDEKIYVMDIIITKIGDEIAKRSPSILYYKHGRKQNADVTKKTEAVDLSFFLKSFKK